MKKRPPLPVKAIQWPRGQRKAIADTDYFLNRNCSDGFLSEFFKLGCMQAIAEGYLRAVLQAGMENTASCRHNAALLLAWRRYAATGCFASGEIRDKSQGDACIPQGIFPDFLGTEAHYISVPQETAGTNIDRLLE